MKKVCLIISVVMLCFTFSYTQDNLTPTEVENATLAKLKAQDDALNATLQLIDAQMQVLAARKYIAQQEQAQKKSQMGGYINEVKKNHKWGDEILYNEGVGESGSFVKQQNKTTESPVKTPVTKSPTEKK